MVEQSWYKQNLKKLNELTNRLTRYNLQGSYDQELDLKEVLMVLQNMSKEISMLQRIVQEKEGIIGTLKVEVEKLTPKKDEKIIN
jgi:hypothetical protein